MMITLRMLLMGMSVKVPVGTAATAGAVGAAGAATGMAAGGGYGQENILFSDMFFSVHLVKLNIDPNKID